MSEWYKIEDQEDVEMSEDGKELEVWFTSNRFGSCYIEIPIEYITNILEKKK